MSRCKCGREIAPLIQTRSDQRTSIPETLRIQINIGKPGKLVPGTAALYCYWKLSLYLDLAKISIHVYVPPEWRMIEEERLNEWVGQLRDNPFEDIVLGQTSYEWTNDVLLPKGQDYLMVPIPGCRGWPELEEPVPYWDTPRETQVSGRYLPIAINRRFISSGFGIGRIICYWKTTIPVAGKPDYHVWVPPEWRRLPPKIRAIWKRRIAGKVNQEIQLGGVTYMWYQQTLLPIGQRPGLIDYLGQGKYRDVQIEEPKDDDDEEPREAMDLSMKPTPEDMEVADYSLRALLDSLPADLTIDFPIRTVSEIETDLKLLEPPTKVSRKETSV